MDNTKKKILDAAAELFVRNGFFGTSISDIASAADINQSLIYYHIGNKEKLWSVVKDYLIKDYDTGDKTHLQFESFVSHIIDQRIAIYEKDPRILRLIQWQMLEKQENLVGNNSKTPISWISNIRLLQEKRQVTTEYSAELIVVYIHSLVNGLLMDAFHIFTKNPSLKKQYIAMIKKEVIRHFQSIKLEAKYVQ